MMTPSAVAVLLAKVAALAVAYVVVACGVGALVGLVLKARSQR